MASSSHIITFLLGRFLRQHIQQRPLAFHVEKSDEHDTNQHQIQIQDFYFTKNTTGN